MAVDLVFVVMGGGIVFGAYRRSDLAMRHARCITGTSAVPLDLNSISSELRDCIEILTKLPPEIERDMEIEWESDDETPPIVEESIEFDVDDFEE